jgi:hypothetical protein
MCAPRAAYPELARVARVSGVVEFNGVVGQDGRIKSLELKSGHFLLVGAAMDAAKRYRYKPAIGKICGKLIPFEELRLISVPVNPDSSQGNNGSGCEERAEAGEHN